MEQLMSVIQDYWLLIVIGFVVVAIALFILRLIRAVVMVAVLAGVILVFGYNYTPDQAIDTIASAGKKTVAVATEKYQEVIEPVLKEEGIENAQYTENPDGTYSVKTKSVEIIGKKGAPTATIIFKGQTYDINLKDMSQEMKTYLETKQQGTAAANPA